MATDGYVKLNESRWAMRYCILSGEFAGVLEDVLASVTETRRSGYIRSACLVELIWILVFYERQVKAGTVVRHQKIVFRKLASDVFKINPAHECLCLFTSVTSLD